MKNSWQITVNLFPQTIERLTHSDIITSTCSSNQGNLLTNIEIENLYRNLSVKKPKTHNKQEVDRYLKALEIVLNHYNNIPITESYILKLHDDILMYSSKDAGHKGKYNRVEAKNFSGNIIGVIFKPTPPYLVKKEIQELIDWYESASAACQCQLKVYQ